MALATAAILPMIGFAQAAAEAEAAYAKAKELGVHRLILLSSSNA